MGKLSTWGGRSSFEYTGSAKEGTRILYGSGHSVFVSGQQYSALLAHFRGRTVNVGTSRTDPPTGSVGEWLQQNVVRTAIAPYVAAILLHERYAQRASGAYIHFN